MLTPDTIARLRVAMLDAYPEASEAFWFVRHGGTLPQLRGRVGTDVIYLGDTFVTHFIGQPLTPQNLEQIADVWNNR